MDIYKRLGVKTLINGWGTVTKVGGSLMAPEVLEAMTEASKHFVEVGAFKKAAGKHIARLLGSEACCITCGAAAGLAIATAACIAGDDPVKRLKLPNTEGMRNEVIMLKCHRILYDQAVWLTGAKVVEVGMTSSAIPEQVEAAIGEKTAALLYVSEAEPMRGSIPLETLMPILKRHNIPVIVDAAAEVPPKANITKYQRMGADLVVFSGGKELRGPQSSGLILGRRDLIEACDQACCPNYGIGRSMKIDKETVAGITRAIELFVEKDYDEQERAWTAMSLRMAKTLEETGDARVRTGYPEEPGIQPVNILRVYIAPRHRSAQAVYSHLLSLDPQVYTGLSGEELVINPQCMSDDEIEPMLDAVSAAIRE